MYIFDGTFGDRDGSKALLADYCIPVWFQEDLMRLAGDRRRPPYRFSPTHCLFFFLAFHQNGSKGLLAVCCIPQWSQKDLMQLAGN